VGWEGRDASDDYTYADIDFVLLVRVHCCCFGVYACCLPDGGLLVGGAWLIQSKISAVGVTRSCGWCDVCVSGCLCGLCVVLKAGFQCL
jgi:hypothetical protein